MFRDGLFQRFPCERVYGMHNKPGVPVGQFAIRDGAAMAGCAFFDLTSPARAATAPGRKPASIRWWWPRT